MSPEPALLLEVSGVTKRFGGVEAVRDIDLGVPARTVVGLIGPNGAGKTTLINLLTGHVRADAGSIRFGGVATTRLRPHAIARLGIARTFQGIRLFKGLSALDNVLVGRHARVPADALARLVRFGRTRDAVAERLLARVGLAERAASLAGELPYGDQRRLEIARALASEPLLLILDEPAAGMNATESAALRVLIRSIAGDDGIAVILIEHDMRLVMDACDRIAVMDLGRRIAEGAPADIRADPRVREAYLGAEDA